MSIKQERAAFEDWCGSQSLAVSRLDGEYIHDDTWTSWEAWRARAKAIELDRQGRGEPHGVIVCDKRVPNAMETFIPWRLYKDSRWSDDRFSKVSVYTAPPPAAPTIKDSLTVAEPVKEASDAECERQAAYQAGFDAALEQVKARIGAMQNKEVK